MRQAVISSGGLGALALVLQIMAGSGVAQAAEPPVLSTPGTLTLCDDPSFPPMEYFEHPGDAVPVGVDVDLGAALAGHWGLKLRVVPTDFSGLLPALNAGRCDVVISGIFYTEARAKSFSAVPYLRTSIVVLARADAGSIKAPADLSGQTVAIEAGTSYAKILDKLNADLAAAGKPAVTVQTYPKQTDAIQQVLGGRAVATLTQDTEAGFRDIQAPGQFKTIYTYPDPEQFALYLKLDARSQASAAAAIDALTRDGSVGRILAKWKLPAGNVIPAR